MKKEKLKYQNVKNNILQIINSKVVKKLYYFEKLKT